MNNINLADMDTSSMLDVIHYYFDEDLRYGSVEGAHAHGTFREHIYQHLYGYEYEYSTNPNKQPKQSEFTEDGTEIKPFIPATEFDPNSSNPFGAVLDSPIG